MSKPRNAFESRHRARSLRKPWGLAVGLLSLALASVANAGPIHYYAELLTAGVGSGLPGDVRAQVDATYDPATDDILLDGSLTAGDGLGSGYVAAGGSLAFTHRFRPAAAVESIIAATLSVATLDDAWLDGGESVDILLDGSFWAGGNATVQLFAGSVSASLFRSDGEAVVSVTSTRGDVNVVASVFEVVYSAVGSVQGSGGGIAAVPEPGAMMLFGAGIGVVGVATRRRT